MLGSLAWGDGLPGDAFGALADGALAEGVAVVLPPGRICEVTKSGPKRWTTIPEGGGVGSWRASAGNAQRDANIAVDRSLIFKDFLRRVGRAP